MFKKKNCAFFVACISIIAAEWNVEHVVVLTRHGERGPLYKDPFTFEENLDALSALTPEGERQCYLSGVTLRERYMNETSTANIDGLINFSTSTVMVNSSDTDRTLATAMAINIGLFPPQGIIDGIAPPAFDLSTALTSVPYNFTLVPVRSYLDRNDVDIRAYTKCPAYNTAVENLYKTSDFLTYEEDNGEFFAALEVILSDLDLCTSQFDDGKILLSNFYNLYDCLNTEDSSVVPEVLDEEVLLNIKEIVDWLEQEKHRPDIVGRMLGGNLLVKVMSFFSAAVNGDASIKLSIVSGHYPTMKGLLSILGLQDSVYGIPEYAAHICIELVDSGESWGVRIMFRNGPENDIEPLFFPDSTGIVQDDEGVVDWTVFNDFLSLNNALYQMESEWCDECGNSIADICLAAEVSLLFQLDVAAQSNVSYESTFIALSAVIGALVGASLSFLARKRWPIHKSNNFEGIEQTNRAVV